MQVICIGNGVVFPFQCTELYNGNQLGIQYESICLSICLSICPLSTFGIAKHHHMHNSIPIILGHSL